MTPADKTPKAFTGLTVADIASWFERVGTFVNAPIRWERCGENGARDEYRQVLHNSLRDAAGRVFVDFGSDETVADVMESVRRSLIYEQ